MEPDTQPHPPGKLPLVMLHGFGAGLLQFYKNFDGLHADRWLHAMDLPGFARSSRVPFTPDAEAAEGEYVELIEKWREGMGLDRFILLGHSFGAFLACSYAMKYPSRVRHLVLVDPWGFSIKPAIEGADRGLPLLISTFATRFNPLSPIRAVGPFGPSLMARIRPDLTNIFGEPFMNYVYHCNAQEPSGETAFFHMQIPIGWAKRPMLERIGTQLDPLVPITMVYGLRSWMDSSAGQKVNDLRPFSYVSLYHVRRAGHHVHADQPEEFNDILKEVYSVVDSDQDRTSVDQSTLP
eukprot:Em0018g49a